MNTPDWLHRLTDWLNEILSKGWPGIAAWVGGFGLQDLSTLASAFSWFAGGVWFLVQTYFHIKNRGRK